MMAELQQCQEMVSSGVSGRMSNVLCPAVDFLVGEVEIRREGGGGGDDDDKSEEPSKKRKLNNTYSNNTQFTTLPAKERRINHYTLFWPEMPR